MSHSVCSDILSVKQLHWFLGCSQLLARTSSLQSFYTVARVRYKMYIWLSYVIPTLQILEWLPFALKINSKI